GGGVRAGGGGGGWGGGERWGGEEGGAGAHSPGSTRGRTGSGADVAPLRTQRAVAPSRASRDSATATRLACTGSVRKRPVSCTVWPPLPFKPMASITRGTRPPRNDTSAAPARAGSTGSSPP